MGRDLQINGEEVDNNDNYGAGRHCDYILSGIVTRTEIFDFIERTMVDIKNNSISDIDDALMGVCAMAKIASIYFETNPYIKAEIISLQEDVFDLLVAESKIDENDDILWIVDNVYDEDAEEHIINTFYEDNNTHKIDAYKDLDIERYVEEALKRYHEIKTILEDCLQQKYEEYDENNTIDIVYE